MASVREFLPNSSSSSISEKDIRPKKSDGSVHSKDEAFEYSEECDVSENTGLETKRPLWRRILAGDVDERYQMKRAMGSRHLVMIGPPFYRALVRPHAGLI